MKMSSNKKRLTILGVLVGIIILALSIFFKSSPTIQPNFDKARLVSVQALILQPTAPLVLAFGRVLPKTTWQAIAEVNGKVIYRHPGLESGRLLKAGTLVLKIDPFEYELKKAQAIANVNASKAQLTRLQQEQKNISAGLEIEQEKLQLIDQEYRRKLSLKKKNLISNSDLETQKQTLLAQKNVVLDLNSTLKLLPDDNKVALAELNVNQAMLDDAQRQLLNTQITLPFDARIANVDVENAQVVALGGVLFEAYKLGTVEVKAELSLQDADILMSSVQSFPTQASLPNVEELGFGANIELQIATKQHQWPAKLTRIADNINAEQATIGFYLEVEQDVAQFQLGAKPPLTKGMFVSANIHGFASSQFMIPEKALHGDLIYVMQENKQLAMRKVQVHFRNKQGVAISGDIKEGEWLILNDLVPAIPGMTLKVQEPQKAATSVQESSL